MYSFMKNITAEACAKRRRYCGTWNASTSGRPSTTSPLRTIAQIPFHLVVSFLPDTSFKKGVYEKNLDFQYSHYPREENPPPVDKPTKKMPLIYNILGDFSEGDVINHLRSSLQYLSGIMGKRDLPACHTGSLQESKDLSIPGVHFERWYVQLILRIITTRRKRRSIPFLRRAAAARYILFNARRLELDFLEIEPIDFLNQLYEECARSIS